MIVVKTIEDLQKNLSKIKSGNQSRLGFIPTMGALHEGHLSLIRQSKEMCEATAVSIFVNPLQFNDPSDLENYPVTTERDLNLCEQEKADIVFIPERGEMYRTEAPTILFQIGFGMDVLCAPGRPGHFEGVLHIVARLFHLFYPDVAFFGKKDFQQLAFIKRMVKELNFPLEIIGCDTLREKNGLAMSSRNLRIPEQEKEDATLIYRALKLGKKIFEERDSTPDEIREIVSDVIKSGSKNRVEYVEIVNPATLEAVSNFQNIDQIVIAAAVFVGNIRLIDNIECEK